MQLLFARLAFAAALAWLVSGCGNVTQLHIEDTSSPLMSARAVHRLGGGPGGSGIEIEVSSVRGKGPQQLTLNETAYLGTQSISGPAALQHTARVQQAQLLYNHLLFPGRTVELEWFVGASWTKTNWESLSANPADARLSHHGTWYGPAGGALGRLRLSSMLALEARYSGSADVSSGPDSGSRHNTELVLAFKPVPVLVLRAGWAESRSWLRPGIASTELSVRVRGPFANLGFEF